MIIGSIRAALKSVELYLTIKSKKTDYDIYYDACKREEEIQSGLIDASVSPHRSDALVTLFNARLREQATVRQAARDNLRETAGRVRD